MKMNLFNLCLFLVFCLYKPEVESLARTLPKNFKQCRKSDPGLGKCLQEAVLDAFKKMRTGGIPSLGVLPLEPLVVNDIKIDPGADGPVTMKLHFMNLKMHGIPDSNFIKYNADLKEARLTTTAVTSKLWFEADYRADGKVLLLPVKGSGKCNVTLTELSTDAILNFKPETRNGETYWIIQSFKNKFHPKKVTVFFEGLLKGDRRLSTGINNFLNDNWKIVFEELGPSFEESFGAVFKEITSRVFSRVSIPKGKKLRLTTLTYHITQKIIWRPKLGVVETTGRGGRSSMRFRKTIIYAPSSMPMPVIKLWAQTDDLTKTVKEIAIFTRIAYRGPINK